MQFLLLKYGLAHMPVAATADSLNQTVIKLITRSLINLLLRTMHLRSHALGRTSIVHWSTGGRSIGRVVVGSVRDAMGWLQPVVLVETIEETNDRIISGTWFESQWVMDVINLGGFLSLPTFYVRSPSLCGSTILGHGLTGSKNAIHTQVLLGSSTTKSKLKFQNL